MITVDPTATTATSIDVLYVWKPAPSRVVYDWKPTNRDRSKAAKKTQGIWCGCDRAKVGQFGRCPVCRRKLNPKKIKQPCEE